MKRTNHNFTEMIIRYFDGDLTPVEIEKLFIEIEKNEMIRKEFDSIKNIYDLRSDINNVKVNEEYLSSILPKFRSKLEKANRKKIFNPKFALALIVALISATILFLLPTETERVITNISDIPDEELIQHLSQDFSDLIQDDKIDSLFKAEIKSAPDKISYYVFNGDDIQNLYQKELITIEDENEIYLTLIDKKF
ncbi:MAG: hypothetical protein ACK4R9_14370 [Ignavibacterium sp.]